jgi:hypothetical protein
MRHCRCCNGSLRGFKASCRDDPAIALAAAPCRRTSSFKSIVGIVPCNMLDSPKAPANSHLGFLRWFLEPDVFEHAIKLRRRNAEFVQPWTVGLADHPRQIACSTSARMPRCPRSPKAINPARSRRAREKPVTATVCCVVVCGFVAFVEKCNGAPSLGFRGSGKRDSPGQTRFFRSNSVSWAPVHQYPGDGLGRWRPVGWGRGGGAAVSNVDQFQR